MAISTLATLDQCRPVTWMDTRNATFSQALEAGLTHSNWLLGPMTDLFGQVVALVSHSVPRENVEALTTRATFGPLFGGSSPSVDLQMSLENKLRARMDVHGSPEYALTWKQWDMSAGEPICALRASGRHTSGKGCSGVPTASSREWKDTPGMSTTGVNPDGSIRKREDQLPRVATLFGPTQSGGPAATESSDEFRPDGFDTPRGTGGGNISRGHDRKNELLLALQAKACGWQTTKAKPGKYQYGNGNHDNVCLNLAGQVELAGYGTPKTITGGPESAARKPELGREESGGGDLQAHVLTLLPPMDGWILNPRFSLWLMGFPPIWFKCACRMVGKSIGKHSPWLRAAKEEPASSKEQETR